MALAHHLRALGKTVHILNSDPMPEHYQFLDPDSLISVYSAKKHRQMLEQGEVFILLDASSGWSRFGRVGEDMGDLDKMSVCIDHHLNPTAFATIMHINPNVIATGELVFDLISTMQGEFTPLIAQALYAAIITDSGSFRFEKTSPQTHHIAAKLLQIGINHSEIYRLIYEQNSLNKINLKGYVLQNIRLAYQDTVAYVGLSEETLNRYQISAFNVDSFSGVGLDIQGVRMSVFAIVLPRGRVKMSLRSDGSIPVNKIAEEFSGGRSSACGRGHRRGEFERHS